MSGVGEAGDVPAPGWHSEAPPRAAGMTATTARYSTGDGGTAGRGPGIRSRNAGTSQRPPNSERRSRRSGAKSETRRTRAPRSLRDFVVSRVVSSSISEVASAASVCGTAGPASTERWRSRRELVALLPQVIAGTLALLRTVI